MKKVFFMMAIVAFSGAVAQDNKTPFVKPVAPKTNSFEAPKFYVFNSSQPRMAVSGKLVATLANGNKVYALSQDNMPCVVPDVTHYNMPVLKPNITYTIPNPALPNGPINTPTVLTEEQLKKLIEMQNQHP